MEQEGQRVLIEFWLSTDSFHQQLASNDGAYDVEQAQRDAMVLYDRQELFRILERLTGNFICRYFSMQATSPLGFDDGLRMEIENNICRGDDLGPSADCFEKPFRCILNLMEQVRRILKLIVFTFLFFRNTCRGLCAAAGTHGISRSSSTPLSTTTWIYPIPIKKGAEVSDRLMF